MPIALRVRIADPTSPFNATNLWEARRFVDCDDRAERTIPPGLMSRFGVIGLGRRRLAPRCAEGGRPSVSRLIAIARRRNW
jgi:hypothetical protein